MSTSYQTFAKPRGRRDTDSSDRQHHSRAHSSEPIRILPLLMTRSVDEHQPANTSRPNSPALVVQKNRTFDERPPRDDHASPKASTSSSRPERQSKDTPGSAASSNEVSRSTPVLHTGPSTQGLLPAPHSSVPSHSSVSSNADLQSPNTASATISSTAISQISAPEAMPSTLSASKPKSGGQPKVEGVVDISLKEKKPAPSEPPLAPPEAPPSKGDQVPTPKASPEEYGRPINPRSATPVVSPPQSPKLAHIEGYPGQWYYPPVLYPNPYYQAPFPPPSDYGSMTRDVSVGSNDLFGDNDALLHRVAGVIPEIHRLLDQYRETHGQLSARDLLAKQAAAVHSEQINKIQLELQVTRTEYEKAIHSVVDENNQFRREIQDLRSQISASQNLTQESLTLKRSLGNLQASHQDLQKHIEVLKVTHAEEMSEKDSHCTRAVEAHKHAMEDNDLEHTRTLTDHKVILSKLQLELANLITKHSNQKKELEMSRAAENELKKQLEEQADRRAGNLETLKSPNAKDNQTAVSEREESSAKLTGDQSSTTEKEHIQAVEALKAEMLAQKVDFEKAKAEHEAYRLAQEAHRGRHEELAEAMLQWRVKQEDMKRGHEKVEKLLKALGYGAHGASS